MKTKKQTRRGGTLRKRGAIRAKPKPQRDVWAETVDRHLSWETKHANRA